MAHTTVKKTTRQGLPINIYDMSGAISKTVDGDTLIKSGANMQLIEQYIRVYLTNQRQGTASTKTRSEVAGSTRKIFRQKGTGKARHGSLKAPIFAGGGITFGPKPKDYSLKMNKKQKRLALLSSLALQIQKGNVMGLTDEFLSIKPKTKNMFEVFKKLQILDKKVLIMTPLIEKNNFILATRNIPTITLSPIHTVNPYKILNSEKVIFIESAFANFKDYFLQHEN